MFKKFVAMWVALLVAFAGVVAFAPSASAAVPLLQNQVVIYQHHQNEPNFKASEELARLKLVNQCSSAGTFFPLTIVQQRIISAAFFHSPYQNSNCNGLWVGNVDGRWYGECVSRHVGNWGYNFGPDYNDRSTVILIRQEAGCPPW